MQGARCPPVVLVRDAAYRGRMPRRSLILAILAGAAAFAAPGRADACFPASCSAWKAFTPAFGPTIPAEGVLVFQYTFGEYTDPSADALAALTFSVEDEGGAPIAGTLALGPALNTLVWRPDAPLSPGTSYSVELVADNTTLDESWCADAMVTLQADFAADDLGLPITAPPPIEAVFSSALMEDFDLAALVCCDDATPYTGGCDSPPWDTGFCASTQGWGWLNAELSLDAAVWKDARGQLGYNGFDFGATSSQLQSPQSFCVTPEAINFATGETVKGPMLCPDAAVAAELGAKPRDPGAALATSCIGDPYTCVVDGGTWDRSMCQPWGAGDSDTTPTEGGSDMGSSGADTGQQDGKDGGCACDSAPRSSPAGLLVLLALLRRRRRARSLRRQGSQHSPSHTISDDHLARPSAAISPRASSADRRLSR